MKIEKILIATTIIIIAAGILIYTGARKQNTQLPKRENAANPANVSLPLSEGDACDAILLHENGENLYVQFYNGTNRWRYQFVVRDGVIALKASQTLCGTDWK